MKIELYGDGVGFVELIDHLGSDLSVVNSARVSFGKEREEIDPADEKLIEYLVRHKHTSTLEHCIVTFRFKVPLFISKQHMRHRTWSYNEISRRYTDFNIEFYEPQKFRKQSKSNRQASIEEYIRPIILSKGKRKPKPAASLIEHHHRKSLMLYEELLEAGVCREQARGVLPQNMYTEYYGTANLNNIIKFVDLRAHRGAQWEIQQVAEAVLDIAESLFPVTMGAYRDLKYEQQYS